MVVGRGVSHGGMEWGGVSVRGSVSWETRGEEGRGEQGREENNREDNVNNYVCSFVGVLLLIVDHFPRGLWGFRV